MSSVSIRVSDTAREKANALAQKLGTSQSEVVARGIQLLEEQLFWKEARASFASLKRNPEHHEEYQQLINQLDGALDDGILAEDWSDYYDA
jgi:Arc/MetJ-type ribon-helix-helix transcriptional regulator